MSNLNFRDVVLYSCQGFFFFLKAVIGCIMLKIDEMTRIIRAVAARRKA